MLCNAEFANDLNLLALYDSLVSYYKMYLWGLHPVHPKKYIILSVTCR